jgi:signal transduction histidine kinase
MEENEPVSVWPLLVAGAMFDLKTPISIVNGYGRMLERERCGPITEKQRTAAQAIQHAARQISEVVDALQGLASLQGAGWRVEMTTISLRQVLSEVGRLPAEGGKLLIDERQGSIDVRIQAEHDEVIGALALVRRALVGLVRIVAFDQLNGERPLSIWIVDSPTASELWIVLAATDQIREAVRAPRESLSPLRWTPRGWSMDLPFASGIVQAHGGQLLALPEGIPGMVVALPKLSAT